jgi:hypothetical protein
MAQLELAINELMIVSDGADLVAEKLSRVARALEQWSSGITRKLSQR